MKKNLLFLILIGVFFAGCDPKPNAPVTIVYRALVTFSQPSLPYIDRSPKLPGDYQYTLYKIEKIINEGSNAVQFDFIPGQIHLSYDYAGKKHLNSYHSSIDNDEPYSLIRQYLIDPITPIVINAGEVKNFSSKTQPSPYFMICYPAPAFPDSVNEASVSTREIASRYTYKTFYTQEKDRYITVFPRYGNQLVPYYRHINKEQLIKIMNEN